MEWEVERQAQQPMLTKSDWENHLSKGISPEITYLLTRFRKGGNCHNLVKFYDGAKIFDPNYAKTVNTVDVRKCIDQLKLYLKVGRGK